MKKILCAFAALMILLSAAACGMSESVFVDNRETDKIYPERLNLRAQPSANSDVLYVLPYGMVLSVLGEGENGFLHVQWGGYTGYVSGDYVTPFGAQ